VCEGVDVCLGSIECFLGWVPAGELTQKGEGMCVCGKGGVCVCVCVCMCVCGIGVGVGVGGERGWWGCVFVCVFG
jgi:hypothetical protein